MAVFRVSYPHLKGNRTGSIKCFASFVSHYDSSFYPGGGTCLADYSVGPRGEPALSDLVLARSHAPSRATISIRVLITAVIVVSCVSIGMLLLPPKDGGAATQSPAAKPSADSLIASTFDALKSVATSVVPSAVVAPTAAATAPVAIAPVTRVVSTIAIHTIAPPDQTVPMNVAPGVVAASDAAPAATPDTAAPEAMAPVPLAPAPANAAPIPAARPASMVASVKAAAPTPTAAPTPAAAPQPQAAAPAKSTTMVVGNGTGVIVHASASGASPKLFVLAAGQKVTVIGSNQGWRNIVDAQGRRGWAYSDYLN